MIHDPPPPPPPPPGHQKLTLSDKGEEGVKNLKKEVTLMSFVYGPLFQVLDVTKWHPIIIGYTNILTDSNIEICWTKISLEIFYLWYHLHLLRKSRKRTNIITHVLRQWDFLLLPNALAVAFSTSIWPRTTITTY